MRRRWLLPQRSQVLELLEAQGAVVLEGMEAFERWALGAPGAEAEVRALEHRADDARRAVQREVRAAFITEISPEDAFELSEHLDDIMNAAKNLVREAEVVAMPPDQPIVGMVQAAHEGVQALVDSFSTVRHDRDAALAAADTAIRTQRAIEKIYRSAMSDLLSMDDLREVAGRRELYRRCVRIGDRIDALADRIWYAIIKQG